jgi:hypothetical protein
MPNPDFSESAYQRAAQQARWAKLTPAERSRQAKKRWLTRWENKVDPERRLSPKDRAKMVESAIRAHNSRIAFQRQKNKRMK